MFEHKEANRVAMWDFPWPGALRRWRNEGMPEEPELCLDMMGRAVDVNLALLDITWDAGYTFDMLNIRDDMGYKFAQFFSLKTYREVVKPSHVKAVEWARRKGIKVCLYSYGYIMPFLPEILEVGFDALHLLEVKACMNPEYIKIKYGKDLVIHGGYNAMMWKDLDIKAEI